jgi:hypothetical protein
LTILGVVVPFAVVSEKHVVELEAELVDLIEVASIATSSTDRSVDGMVDPIFLRKAGFLSLSAHSASFEEAAGWQKGWTWMGGGTGEEGGVMGGAGPRWAMETVGGAPRSSSA